MLRDRRRILVVGSGGAGKSTFARELGSITGLPVIHLDRHFWKAGWVPTPTEEWLRVAARLATAPAWIIDGNYGGSLPVRLPRCDAVVFLDISRTVCLWRVLRRRLSLLHGQRSDVADGCHERLTLGFLRWIWSYPNRSRLRLLEALASAPRDAEVIRVRSRRAVRELLERARIARRETSSDGREPGEAVAG